MADYGKIVDEAVRESVRLAHEAMDSGDTLSATFMLQVAQIGLLDKILARLPPQRDTLADIEMAERRVAEARAEIERGAR